MRILLIISSFLFTSNFYAQREFLKIDSLVAINLEEDKSALIPKDEIVLIYGNYNNATFKIAETVHSDLLIFSDSIRIQQNFKPLEINDSCELFIALIEMDSENIPLEKIIQRIKEGIESDINFPYQLFKDKINQRLEDDDLLGFEFLTNTEYKELNSLVFSGRHFFNKYEYQVYFAKP